jgi:hypothetical protein
MAFSVANVGSYIYDVKVSGFTMSSIYRVTQKTGTFKKSKQN